MQLTTFGFEMEVQTEAPALTRRLYDDGHIGMSTMHRWHCNCDDCSLHSGFLFKSQTDSSCSGEVITNILHHDPADFRYSPDVFTILQAAAVDSDAEPGWDAGMHVHVGVGQLGARQKDNAFAAFHHNESMLLAISAGRFTHNRSANTRVRDSVSLLDGVRDARQYHEGNDRHSNLNLSTGHGTWEYRLWNSTRSAWRMELFTRLSVALVDPGVTSQMCYEAINTHEFGEILLGSGHDDAAWLLARQLHYINDAAQTAPSTLTNL